MPGKPSKTALVLAGGGLTGAMYEIGALRAINDLLLDRTVNDIDIFIGTSAGAIVASSLANGLSPEEMMQANAGFNPDIRPIRRQDLFNLSRTELLYRLARFPQTVLGAWSHYFRHMDDMSLFDLLWSLLEALPSGFYDGLALERYLRETLLKTHSANCFDQIEKELYIIATDLDTGERAVFGRGYLDAPISLAVAASSALPVVYKPVRIDKREYVDGGMRGNASLDLAIEHGAKLVICINPLVPFDNSDHNVPLLGPDGGYLSAKGLQAITNQVTRINLHSGLHYHIKQLRRSHPDVDIILIEPRPDDRQMFFYNVMRYSARLIIARHGFESVTLDLAEEYPRFKATLGRHGIPISRRRVIEELAAIHDSGDNPNVVRDILETGKLPNASTAEHLRDTLTDLDALLANL
ncbi:MAG TPA: patatin-like phospholipase family protein [Anaerolineales bacterium]|nr:patatin-like phospholipase family protein [Anaerolineales bacterium]